MRSRLGIRMQGRTNGERSRERELSPVAIGTDDTLLRVFQSIMLRASANSAASNASTVLITALGSENASRWPSEATTDDWSTLSSSVAFTSVTSSEKYAEP